MDLGQYLAGLDHAWASAPTSQPLHARVGYHQPCHLRALDIGMPGLDLIRKIPELDVEFINRGCSGMGGTYGLRRWPVPYLAPRRAWPPATAQR